MSNRELTSVAGRNEFRACALQCLGGEWPAPPPLEAKIVDRIDRPGYSIEKVRYQVEPGEFVSAFILAPATTNRATKNPAIALWHQHNGEFQIGKSEPAGLMGNPIHHTGVELVREGFVVICPDAICFEERSDDLLRDGNFERFTFLRYIVDGKSLAWKNILDMRRAIDYLVTRDDVDCERIGCYGHSLGSTFTWLLGPWETRLKCLVGNCCLPTYDAMHARHILHSFSNFVPGLHVHGDNDDLVALIAPKPLHLNFGALDSESPIDLLRPKLGRIKAVYEAMGASENFSYFIDEEAGHTLSSGMWKAARDKLREHLRV